MKPRTITQTQADAAMRELGCQIRMGGTSRGGAGLYCATHHEPAINDGPIRETCRTAAGPRPRYLRTRAMRDPRHLRLAA